MKRTKRGVVRRGKKIARKLPARSRRPVARRSDPAPKKKSSKSSGRGKKRARKVLKLSRTRRATAGVKRTTRPRATKRARENKKRKISRRSSNDKYRRQLEQWWDNFGDQYYPEYDDATEFAEAFLNRAPESSRWGTRADVEYLTKNLQTRKDGSKPITDYRAEIVEVRFESAIKTTIDGIESRLQSAVLAETDALLERTGGSAIYQKIQVRMPDGTTRWISKKRTRGERSEIYTESFFMALKIALQAYGAMFLDFDDIADRDLDDEPEIGEFPVEVLAFDVETVLDEETVELEMAGASGVKVDE